MILVVGSNGLLGGMIARRLVAAGRPVKLLVRQPSRIADAETVRGDLKDPASLEAACRGASTVITTATSAQRGGDDTVDSVDLRGNRNLIDAAGRAGVRQFVFVSTSHVDVTSPVPLFAAKAQVENHLRASGMPWTILAPHAFMDVWIPLLVGSALAAGQPVPVVAPGRARHSFIAVDDVAEFAVRAVDRPAAVGSRLMLGGPEALSWTDIVSRTSAMLGRLVPVQHIQPGEPIPTLPPDLGRVVGGLAAGLEQGDVIVDASDTARAFGVSLTPIETVLRRLLAGSSA